MHALPARAVAALGSAGLAAALLGGCKAPPDAPGELSDLTAYLFEHVADEDPAALEAAVESLAVWFDDNGLEEPEEGFTVAPLSFQAAQGLPGLDLSGLSQEEFTDGLVGAAVVSVHRHDVDGLAEALVAADQMEVFPDDYKVFERSFIVGPDCFIAHDCELAEATNYSESTYAGILSVTSENYTQWRWVETEERTALVHRSWLTAPADIDPALAEIPAQFFTTAAFRLDDGTVVRMQTVWFVALLASIEANNFMLNNFIKSLRKSGEQVEAWLDDP